MSQVLTLRVGGYAPIGSVHSDALDVFRNGVVEGTDGAVAVEVTWNIMDSGRPNTDLFEMVESGELFMCYFSTSYLGHRVPELDILETPYLFTDLEQAHRALDGALGAVLIDATAAAHRVRVARFLGQRVPTLHQPAAACAPTR